MKKILLLLFCLLPFSTKAAAHCQPATGQALNQWLKAHKEINHVIFFASWCKACKEDIETADSSSIIVSVFDELDLANAIAIKINRKRSKCFWDKDKSVVEVFSVKSLPHSLPHSSN